METDSTVFIIDDEESVRESLLLFFGSLNIKAQAYESPVEFLEQYDPEQPGCLILDVRLPQMSGLELQKKLAEKDYTLPIIILTGYADVSLAVRAMEAGAMTLMEKPMNDQELLDKVQKAFAADAGARKKWVRKSIYKERLNKLSEREREILELLDEGLSNKMIAGKLNISIKTVDFHRSNIKRKLQVESLAELLHMVMETRDDPKTTSL